MNNERQVTVGGAPAAIEAWLQTLSGPIPEGWSRDADIEQRVRRRRNGRWPICLVWSGNSGHPRTAVFLQPVSDAEIGVFNVVPLDRKELTSENRTAVLEAFRAALVAPREDELQWTDRPSSPELPEFISPQAQARFAAFARTTNKTMFPSGLDLTRWYDFLIQLHRDGFRPPREALQTALQEASFGSQVTEQLLDACDHTEDILTRYDLFGEGE